jgi:glucokinase
MRVDLVGDIGATNARFALVNGEGTLSRSADLVCRDHPTIAEAIETYLVDAFESEDPAVVTHAHGGLV